MARAILRVGPPRFAFPALISFVLLASSVAGASSLWASTAPSAASGPGPAQREDAPGIPSGGALGVAGAGFEPNIGQYADPGLRYAWQGGHLSAAFADSAVTMVVKKPGQSPPARGPAGKALELLGAAEPRAGGVEEAATVTIRFVGANAVSPTATEETGGRVSYFLGNDPAKWRSGVPTYNQITYFGLYDGIDLVYRIGDGGIKYQFELGPQTDPRVIEMAYAGATGLSVDGEGRLSVMTWAGPLFDSAPVSTQAGRPVDCDFALRTPQSVAFQCSGIDPKLPLVIDPLISVLYWGVTGFDMAEILDTDAAGNVYVYGDTDPVNFTSTPGAHNGSSAVSTQNVYVAKLNSNRTGFSFVAVVGGGSTDNNFGMDVDDAGNVYASGFTVSADFPTTSGAFDRQFNGTMDGFIFKLSPDGRSLVYSTYLGGSDVDAVFALVVDPSGEVTFSGFSDSQDLATTPGAYDRTPNGGFDGVVGKLNAGGTGVAFLTLLGGSLDEYAESIAVDRDGNIVDGLITASRDFPVTAGAFQPTYGGGSGFGDGAIVKLSGDGARVLYSTYLGGGDDELIFGMALSDDGGVFVEGTTNSSDFPVTAGAFDTTFGGSSNSSWAYKGDGFLAKLNASWASLDFATFYGGSEDDGSGGMAGRLRLDPAGFPVVVGWTYSVDFPTTSNAFDRTYNGGSDGVVVKFSKDGADLLYSSFIGGNDYDETFSVAFGRAGEVFISGHTWSTDFPNNTVPFGATFGNSSGGGFLLTLLLAAPQNLSADPSSAVIRLSWTPPPGVEASAVEGYRLYSWESGNSTVSVVNVSNVTGYLPYGLRNGQEYCYQVSALTALGETERSEVVCSTPAGIPSPPRAVTATPGPGLVNLSWTAPSNPGGVPIVLYSIFRSQGGGNLSLLANVSGLSYTDSNVTAGANYSYQVRAVNDVWSGDPSATMTATPLAPPPPPPPVVPPGPLGVNGPIILAGFGLIGLLAAVIGGLASPPRIRYALLSVGAVPLFARLRKDDVKLQYHRGRLVQYIEDHPGASYSQIRRALALSNGGCTYHLRVLEKSGEIRRAPHGTTVVFYPASTLLDPEALPPLTDTQRRILSVLVETGGGTTGEVTAALEARFPGEDATEVSYNLRSLVRRTGLVSADRIGSKTVYSLTVEQRQRLTKALPTGGSASVLPLVGDPPSSEGPDETELDQGFGAAQVFAVVPSGAVRVAGESDFADGLVRIKVDLQNASSADALEPRFEVDFDSWALRLERMSPNFQRHEGRYLLGGLRSGERKAIELYFDPQRCGRTTVYLDLKFRDARGALQITRMEPREIDVACPVLFTRSRADAGTARKLASEGLAQRGRKVLRLPDGLEAEEAFTLACEVASSLGTQTVEQLRRPSPFEGEGWFYGESKGSGRRFVIRVLVLEHRRGTEFAVAGEDPMAVAGLLAESQHRFGELVKQRTAFREPVQVTDPQELERWPRGLG